MAYLGNSFDSSLQANLPCKGYGDLLFLQHEHENATKVLVQHNLAAFLDRPGLNTTAVGFPVPVFHTANCDQTSSERLPVWQKKESEKIRQNLLCSEFTNLPENEDRSNIRIIYADEVEPSKVYDTVLEFDDGCSRSSESHGQLLKLSPSYDVRSLTLPVEAEELRAFESVDANQKVFVRGKDSLYFCNLKDESCERLFAEPVVDFFQGIHLTDQIVIADAANNLWHGSGSKLARKKVDFAAKMVAPTDCPKIVLVSNGVDVRLVDLRERNSEPELIFKLPVVTHNTFGKETIIGAVEEIYAQRPEKLYHVCSVRDRLFATVVTSDYHHFLVDHRVPGQAVVTMPHATLNGGDYCFVAPPLSHHRDTGLVYNFFCFNHYVDPHITYWPFYLDLHASLWSSVGPMKSLPLPTKLIEYSRSTPGKLSDDYSFKNLPKVTKAVSYQMLPPARNEKNTRALFFRQMDDGNIWMDNLIIDLESNFEINQGPYYEESFSLINKFYQSLEDEGVKFWVPEEELLLKERNTVVLTSDLVELVNVNLDAFDMDEDEEVGAMDAFVMENPLLNIEQGTTPVIEVDNLELVQNVEDDRIFSKMILNSWRKSSAAYMDYIAFQAGEWREEIVDAPSKLDVTSKSAAGAADQESDSDEYNFDDINVDSD